MQRSWWLARGTDIAPWGLTLPFAQSRARSGGQQDPPAPELPVAWPGAWAPGTWLVDLVALRAVLVGNW